MSDLIVVGGPASNDIEREITELTGIKSVKVDYKVFPDGESYIRFPLEPKDDTVIIIQSLFPPQDKHLTELFLMIDTAYDLGAREVAVIVPYMAYSRQDKRFLKGEAISIKVFLKIIEKIGAKYFITVDIHKEESLSILNIPYINIVPTTLFAKKIRELNLNDLAILSPDIGGVRKAREIAQIIGCEYDFLEKKRDRISGKLELKPKEINIVDKNVVIVDDIISTGGTISLAAKKVIEEGAKNVYVMCTHALLVGNAREKILRSGVEEIIATNTIPNDCTKISVTPLIVEALSKLIKAKL